MEIVVSLYFTAISALRTSELRGITTNRFLKLYVIIELKNIELLEK